jgi:hypothetical protein
MLKLIHIVALASLFLNTFALHSVTGTNNALRTFDRKVNQHVQYIHIA